MYVIERGNKSAWLCTTATEAFQARAVNLRLQGELKNFEVFQQWLDNFEKVKAGFVILIYKCSNADSCVDCEKYTRCEIRLNVVDTKQMHEDFLKWVESNGGYTL